MQTLSDAHAGPDAHYSGDKGDWRIAYRLHGGADCLDRSNWDTISIRLGQAAFLKDWDIERSGHWAFGWLDSIIVRPGSDSERIAREAFSDLESYPVLDEGLYSEYQYDAGESIWQWTPTRNRIYMLTESGESIFAARADYSELYERAPHTYYAVQEE